MNRKLIFGSISSCITVCILALSSCNENTQPLVVTPTQILSSTTTPTNYKTIILTPDDLFSFPELVEQSTPTTEDFCENLPQSQIVVNPDKFSILAGRFVLCIYERSFTAMDLDTGNLVSSDDKSGDIVLGSPGGGGENPTYGVLGRNNSYVQSAYVNEAWPNHSGANKLSYEYCKSRLRNQTDHGGMYIGEQIVGDIACVKTTEGQIALLRVEKIYPAITLSVEFSFAILRNE